MPSVIARERQLSSAGGARHSARSDEVMALCPLCKTFETLWFTGSKLVQTRKFTQYGDKVYHDCGSDEPCSLYRIF